MSKKKTKTKTKSKSSSSKAKAKPAKKIKAAPKKTEKIAKVVAKAIPMKNKSDKKEAVKKAALPFSADAMDEGFGEEVIEPTAAVVDPFLSDDFDTSRKELEEGYLDDEEEEEDSKDGDLFAADETESFESYEEEDLDYDDEDDYGPSNFAGPKKKKFEDDYDDEE